MCYRYSPPTPARRHTRVVIKMLLCAFLLSLMLLSLESSSLPTAPSVGKLTDLGMSSSLRPSVATAAASFVLYIFRTFLLLLSHLTLPSQSIINTVSVSKATNLLIVVVPLRGGMSSHQTACTPRLALYAKLLHIRKPSIQDTQGSKKGFLHASLTTSHHSPLALATPTIISTINQQPNTTKSLGTCRWTIPRAS